MLVCGGLKKKKKTNWAYDSESPIKTAILKN